MTSLKDKLLLTKTEIVYYLQENPNLPIFIVDSTGEISYKITYKTINTVTILNYSNDEEQVNKVDSILSSTYLSKSKIYTLDGITKYLDMLDKKNIIKR